MISKNAISYENSSLNPVINLDWLEFFGDGYIPKPKIKPNLKDMLPEDYVHKLSDDVFLRWMGHGSAMYNSLFEIFIAGELFGVLKGHPRNIKRGLKETSIQLEIKNHMLYSNDWLPGVNTIVYLLDLRIQNVTRCDIAIDGIENAQRLMQNYFNQNPLTREINMIGRSSITAHKVKNKTMLAQSFQMGTNKGDKTVSVYCKSDELEVSNKTYIKKFWERNNLKHEGKIHRIEMRFNSKAIKVFKEFDYVKLVDPKYLASLFRTAAKGFFEFSINDNARQDRQTKIKIIDFDKLNGVHLEKNKRPEVSDRYKAKMTIHHMQKLILFNKAKNDKHKVFMLYHIDFLLEMYNLEKWYEKKLEEWKELYRPQIVRASKC